MDEGEILEIWDKGQETRDKKLETRNEKGIHILFSAWMLRKATPSRRNGGRSAVSAVNH